MPDDRPLSEVPLSSHLDQAERPSLASALESRRIPAHAVIFRAGEASDALFLVRRGRERIGVEDTEGRCVEPGEVGPGDVFGELSFLDGGCRSADA